jgi:hypothetical protein
MVGEKVSTPREASLTPSDGVREMVFRGIRMASRAQDERLLWAISHGGFLVSAGVLAWNMRRQRWDESYGTNFTPNKPDAQGKHKLKWCAEVSATQEPLESPDHQEVSGILVWGEPRVDHGTGMTVDAPTLHPCRPCRSSERRDDEGNHLIVPDGTPVITASVTRDGRDVVELHTLGLLRNIHDGSEPYDPTARSSIDPGFKKWHSSLPFYDEAIAGNISGVPADDPLAAADYVILGRAFQ